MIQGNQRSSYRFYNQKPKEIQQMSLTFSSQINPHWHPARSAYVPAAAQCTSGKTGDREHKEGRECLAKLFCWRWISHEVGCPGNGRGDN